MRGASLMQALARVNRRFRNKKDGLLVGYAPLTENLKKALTEYSSADQADQTLYDYPPDHERAAVDLVIRQLETFAAEWTPRATAR